MPLSHLAVSPGTRHEHLDTPKTFLQELKNARRSLIVVEGIGYFRR